MASRVMAFGKTIKSRVALVGLAAALAGCSAVPDYLNPMTLFEDDTPVAEGPGGVSTRAQADQVAAEAGTAPYPVLSSVPDRPATAPPGLRERVVEGLVADRTNARYTADAVQAEADAVSAPGGAAPILPAAGEPTSSATVGGPVVKPAAGPSVARQAGVSVPAPPVLQEAAVRSPAAVTSAVPLPAIPAAPNNPVGTLAASGSADPGKVAPLNVGEMLQLATIQFGDNSTNLDRRDREILRQVAAMQQQAGGTLRIVGHASGSVDRRATSAQERANMDVSMRRANVVAQALVRLGLSPAVIQIEGMSNKAPLYDGSTRTGDAGNRRTEIYLVL
ncbi:MAG: OmpA family protein [Alphaproteobacteria bacterium]